jgi:hypothetical protein
VKRALGFLVLVGVAVGTIDFLGDATQTRLESVKAGTKTELVLEVSLRRSDRDPAIAAESLWSACQWTIRRRLDPPGVVQVGGHTFKMVIVPGLAEQGRRRLAGCLEDATIDRVLGRVVRMTELAPKTRLGDQPGQNP